MTKRYKQATKKNPKGNQRGNSQEEEKQGEEVTWGWG